jgi:type II secretory pathway pseudopilin PulG
MALLFWNNSAKYVTRGPPVSPQSGLSLVEILIAMGLMAILLPALLTGFVTSREGKPQKANRLEATALLREMEEAVRIAREDSWNGIAVTGIYHPEVSGNTWVLVSGVEVIGGKFTRQVDISSVERDPSGAQVVSGGAVDLSTMRIVSTVSWTAPVASSVESTMYLSRYVGNTTWEQTTETDFDNGSHSNTTVANDGGGEVTLSAGSVGGGDWATPVEEGVHDISGSLANALDVLVVGSYAYLGLASGAPNEFVVIDISDPQNPTELGGYDVSGSVYDIALIGSFAYLATGDNNEELIILDISTPSNPSYMGSINLGDNRDAYSIAYIGSGTVLVGKDQSGRNNRELYAVDVSSPAALAIADSVEVDSDVNSIAVQGDYAYVANDGVELLVYDISNTSNISSAGSYDVSGGANGEHVYVSGSRAYLSRGINGNGPEVYILDISNLGSIDSVGTYEVGNNVSSVHVSGDYMFLGTANNATGLEIVDISDESLPVQYGLYDASDGVNDVFVVGSYAYLAASTNDAELIVVLGGGAGSAAYQTSGVFESQTFDAGSVVGFNFVNFSIIEPTGTDINFQVAVSATVPSTSFAGPDGATSTFYTSAAAVPLNSVAGQFFRFKAYLTGDGSETPVLEDFTVNYSP